MWKKMVVTASANYSWSITIEVVQFGHKRAPAILKQCIKDCVQVIAFTIIWKSLYDSFHYYFIIISRFNANLITTITSTFALKFLHTNPLLKIN